MRLFELALLGGAAYAAWRYLRSPQSGQNTYCDSIPDYARIGVCANYVSPSFVQNEAKAKALAARAPVVGTPADPSKFAPIEKPSAQLQAAWVANAEWMKQHPNWVPTLDGMGAFS